MRLALFALALVTLAACDSVGPTDPDALIGTWSLTGLDEEVRVTSTVDQSVPDLSAQASGAVTASGAEAAQLRFVNRVYRSSEEQSIDLTSADRFTNDGSYSELSISRFGTGEGAQAYGVLYAPSGTGYSAFGPFVPFTHDGGRITVPSLTLDDGSGQSVTVGGTLTFPEVALVAGERSVIPRRSFDDEFIEGDASFTFFEDGTFEASTTERNRTTTIEGTWASDMDGEVRIGIRDGNVVETVRYTFEVRDGALRLETTDESIGGGNCPAECRRSYEASTLARAGSFSEVELAIVYRFDEGETRARAAARVAEDGAPRVARRSGIPLFGRIR